RRATCRAAVLRGCGVWRVVFVDVGEAKCSLREEAQNIQPPCILEAVQGPLHCLSHLLAGGAGRELQTRQAVPADLDDVPGALWPLVNTHLALLRSSINARMSAWRQRRVWGAICIARGPTTS